MDYETLSVGDEVARVAFDDVPAADMRLMSALMDDPNPIHFDRRTVEAMGHPGLVTQGTINMGYAVQPALAVAASPAGIESLEFRYQTPVFEGDAVTASATVTDTFRTDAGAFTELDLALEKADGEVAVSGSAVVEVSTDG